MIDQHQLECQIKQLGYLCAVNNAEDVTKPGTALLWKSHLQISDILSIVIGRAQIALLGDYALLNLYAPSGSNRRSERATFYSQSIFSALETDTNSLVIFGGDFNCIVDPIDVENGLVFRQKFCPSLIDLIKVANLVDIFRHVHNKKQEFTFFRPGCASSRLHRLYVTSPLKHNIQNVRHFCFIRRSLWC